MSNAVKQLEDALKDQPKNPLRSHQIKSYEDDKYQLTGLVKEPGYVPGDRGEAHRKAKKIDALLTSQMPRPLDGETKDKVAALAKDIMENEIRPTMLTREEMRRNPAGSVGKFLQQENSRSTKQKIQLWKRAMLALTAGDGENEDPDVANIEKFRPEKIHDTGGTATFMPGAQIPGNFAMTPLAKENWPLGEPQVETPLKQAQKREMSEAQKAALAKAQAARAAKRISV